MALLPPAAQGQGRACLSPQDACARPHLTHVFLLPSLPPHSGQAARLTSPPLAYSITKHRRSWVWKAYFRACEGNQNAGTEGTWTGTLCPAWVIGVQIPDMSRGENYALTMSYLSSALSLSHTELCLYHRDSCSLWLRVTMDRAPTPKARQTSKLSVHNGSQTVP